MHLAIVEVWNGKPEPRVLDERLDCRMFVYVIRRRLLPFLGVRDYEIKMTLNNLTHFLARPEIHLGRGAGATAFLVSRYFWRFTLRGIRSDCSRYAFDNPAVIG